MRSSLLAALSAALLSAPALAFQGGTEIPVDRSGFVLLRSAGATCTAVALTPDLLISARACVGGSEAQNPEMLGWFMGEQDSDDNPVREVSFDLVQDSPFVLLRLTRPLVMNGKGAPIYGGEDRALTGFRCYSFGPTRPTLSASYGDVLAYVDLRVTGMRAGGFTTDPAPALDGLDIGAACFRAGSNELAGLYVTDPIFGGVIVGIARARGWITEFRAAFELVGAQSGLCIGNIPNTTRIWQLPCVAAGQPGRIDQELYLRRFGTHYLIRSGRFPEMCLGAIRGNIGNPAPVRFYGCPPPLDNGSAPWNLPTRPRIQQLWDIGVSTGDRLELRNAGDGLCLEVPGSSRLPGAVLQLGTCRSSGASQQFYFNVTRFEGGTHRVSAFPGFSNGKCADATGDGLPIRSADCTGAASQQYELIPGGSGHDQLIALSLGALGLGCVSASGSSVVQRACAPGLGQEWLFRWLTPLLGYRVRSRDSDRCLTNPVSAGGAAPALTTGVCVSSGAAVSAQRWIAQ